MTTIPPNPEEALVTINTPTSDTVRVRDRVESSRFELYTDEKIELSQVSAGQTLFPVDVAAKISGPWSELTLPMSSSVCVHDQDSGEVLQQISRDTQETTLPVGDYEIQAMPAPVKVFLRINGAPTIDILDDHVRIRTLPGTEIILGIRSPHKQPAGTITTTSRVRDIMRAVSHLGSALKTTSPERSWPTLRGYPPKIETGEKLDIPPTIQRPDVDVQLSIPSKLEAVFQTAPLTYYTGAEVIPIASSETKPALIAADNRIPLEGDLEAKAADLLQKNMIMDSVVRTEGIYPFRTHERQEIEDDLPWDPAEIYDLPLGERISAYEQVSREVWESIKPTWPLTIDVSATKSEIPALSHIAEELAVVRTPKIAQSPLEPQPDFVQDFIRADGGSTQSRTTGKGVTQPNIVTPESWDTQMHTSIRDDYPLGSNSTTIRAFERHINREAPETDAIEVHVICNDDDMREEDVVTEFYGVRDLLEFDVNIHYNQTMEEFKDLLTRTFDLAHYIGHVDNEGIKCRDGYVDIRTDISDVGFDAFLLNACQSVEQGEALLDVGAVGGIATLYDVPNSSATRMGRTLSRLLNRGFTIRSALEIARTASYLGRRWVSMGDGRVSLTQAESFVPSMLIVKPEGERFNIEFEWFETDSHRTGTLVWPNTDWGENYVLPSKMAKQVTTEELEELFSLEVMPVLAKGTLYWTDEISPFDLMEN